MIDQENFQQRPMRTNCKQLQQIGQYLLKYHNHSPIFITNFTHSDQNLASLLLVNLMGFFPNSKF